LLRSCLCSDYMGTEQGYSNWCNVFGLGTRGSGGYLNDMYYTSTQRYVCEREVSPLCGAGWVHFFDEGNVEGSHSCLFINTARENYPTAVGSCPINSHIVTYQTTGKSVGLGKFAASLATPTNSGVWVGAFLNEGKWRWIDGTPNSNLDCGSAGCGVWAPGLPGPA
jgi:hypothetical protein